MEETAPFSDVWQSVLVGCKAATFEELGDRNKWILFSRHLLCLDNLDMPILDLAHCHRRPLCLNISPGQERLYLSTRGEMFCAPGLFDEMKRNSLLSAFISLTCLGREMPTLSVPRGGVVTQSFPFCS